MNEPLPELSPDSRALLQAGRLPEPVPAELAARIWQGVSRALPAGHVATPQTHALAKLARTYTLKQVAIVSAGVFAAGVGAGAGVTVAVGPPRRAPVAAPLPASAPEPSRQAVLAPLPLAPKPASKPARVFQKPVGALGQPSEEQPTAQPPPAPPSMDSSLAAERALIAQARSALQRRAPEDALVALRSHATEFPAGHLAEEREALRVQALVATGYRAAAERAAAEFERKYPQSLMMPAVQAALHDTP